MCRIRLSQGISKHQQLREKSAATARLGANPDGLVVNLKKQPDNRRLRRHLSHLLSTLLHAIVDFLKNVLNVLVQIADKMGLEKKVYTLITSMTDHFRRQTEH
jgi:hypothetical protein